MNNEAIRRQHEATVIKELQGHRCTEFQAVQNIEDGFVGPLYIQLNGVWYRFYLDAGLLFWQEGAGPDSEDDLLEGELYSDLCAALLVGGKSIEEITMRDNVLRLRFEHGALLELKNGPRDEGTRIVNLVPAQESADLISKSTLPK